MKIVTLIALCLSFHIGDAQKEVAAYPIHLGKGVFIAPRDLDSYFLQDPVTKQFMLVLTNNKDVNYVLFNNELRPIENFEPSGGIENTVLRFDREQYLGGIAAKGKFYFVYQVKDKKFLGSNIYYQLEIIDPINKAVYNQQLFEIPNNEKLMLSFGGFTNYFSLTANNKTHELKLYGLNSEGENFIKTIKVEIPGTSSKKTLTDYLEGIEYIVAGEEERAGPNVAASKVKLFYSQEKITILVNEKDRPTQILNISLKDYSSDQTSIDHSSLFDKEETSINSFLFENRIYSLLFNQKNIRIAIYDCKSGQLLKLHQINGETNFDLFADGPVSVSRDVKTITKDIENTKKLIRLLGNAPSGIVAYKAKDGKTAISVCNYHVVSSGPSLPSSFTYSRAYGGGGYNGWYDKTITIPGQGFNSESDNYYNSTYFKLLVEPSTLNIEKGIAYSLVYDQIKDYIRGLPMHVDATNQFSINHKEYFGYYNRWQKAYVIEEIKILQ